MTYPEPLQDIDRYIDMEGQLSRYDASRFYKILKSFSKEAKRKNDVVLAEEVERLWRRVEAATKAPVARMMATERKRVRFGDLADANVVWEQMSIEERKGILKRIGFSEEDANKNALSSHVPLEDVTYDELTIRTGVVWGEMLEKIATYPRSEERRQYLRGQRGGMRRVHLYRRRIGW